MAEHEGNGMNGMNGHNIPSPLNLPADADVQPEEEIDLLAMPGNGDEDLPEDENPPPVQPNPPVLDVAPQIQQQIDELQQQIENFQQNLPEQQQPLIQLLAHLNELHQEQLSPAQVLQVQQQEQAVQQLQANLFQQQLDEPNHEGHIQIPQHIDENEFAEFDNPVPAPPQGLPQMVLANGRASARELHQVQLEGDESPSGLSDATTIDVGDAWQSKQKSTNTLNTSSETSTLTSTDGNLSNEKMTCESNNSSQPNDKPQCWSTPQKQDRQFRLDVPKNFEFNDSECDDVIKSSLELKEKYEELYKVKSPHDETDHREATRPISPSLLRRTYEEMYVSESESSDSVRLKLSQGEDEAIIPETDTEVEMLMDTSGKDDEKMECDSARPSEMKPNSSTSVDVFAPLRQPSLDFHRVMQDEPGPSGLPRVIHNSGSDIDNFRKKQEPKWKAAATPLYTSMKGKGRGKRSKPADPEDEKMAKVGRYTSPLEESNESCCEKDVLMQVVNNLCVEVEESIGTIDSTSSNKLNRSKSDIPVTSEPLVSSDLRANSCFDVIPNDERRSPFKGKSSMSTHGILQSRESISAITSMMDQPSTKSIGTRKILRRVTTTITKKKTIKEEFKEGDIVLKSFTREEEEMPIDECNDEEIEFEDFEKRCQMFDRKKPLIGDSNGHSCDNNTKKYIQEKQLTLNDLPQTFKEIRIGKRVMARWKDGYLYPGKVIGQKDDRWLVHYDDGHIRCATTIFAIEVLPVQLDILIQASKESEIFESGVIMSQIFEENTISYIVELDSGQRKITPHAAVALSIDEVSVFGSNEECFIEPGIAVENIIDGKRRPKFRALVSPTTRPNDRIDENNSKTSNEKLNSKNYRLSRVKRPKPNKSKEAIDDTKSPQKTNTLPERKSPRNLRKILFHPNQSMDTSISEESDSLIITSAHGPIPPIGSGIFSGLKFFITQGPDSSSNAILPEQNLPSLIKAHLVAQITAGGGIVMKDVIEEELKSNASKYRLISDTHCRTIKYMAALAVSIPCVSHLWVIYSCMQNKRLDHEQFLLPTGYSLLSNNVVEWHGKTEIFRGLRFAIKFDDTSAKSCAQLVILVLSLGAGQIVTDSKNFVFGDIDMYIMEDPMPPSKKGTILNCKKPIVTKEWVFHCLIHGCRLDYTAHKKFSPKL